MIGLVISARRELMLQIEAACAGHAHVKNEATGLVQHARLEQLSRRGEAHWLHSRREYELMKSFTNARVVIDDHDERLLLLRLRLG